MNKKESHTRSLLKGISWRIIATSDTILVVLIITCIYGKCSIGNALTIGAIEFFLKLFIYYFHERIWQNIYNSRNISKSKSLYKTISWRVVASSTTFIISGTVLDNFNEMALYIAIFEASSKFILYYFHERLWLKLPAGFFRKLKKLKG